MSAYIIRRCLIGLLLIFMVTIFVFLVMRLLPGDPIYIYMSQNALNRITLEEIVKLRHQYGIDRPMIVQYFDWMGKIFQGDLGESIFYQAPVAKLVKDRFPISLELSFIAWIFGDLLGLVIGIIAALKWGKWIDTVTIGVSYLGITIPSFWLAILLIYVIGLKLGWLPLSGWTSPAVDLGEHIKHIIIPVFCLAVAGIGGTARLMRSSFLEIIRQDYIRTARSKGLQESLIVWRHALKNSIMPIITLMGMGITTIFAGSYIIETLFSIPGMGMLTVSSLFNHDYAVVQFSALLTAFMIIMANLLVDVSYTWFDPRIRYQ
jgi:peptide/nickel transport system permease protein